MLKAAAWRSWILFSLESPYPAGGRDIWGLEDQQSRNYGCWNKSCCIWREVAHDDATLSNRGAQITPADGWPQEMWPPFTPRWLWCKRRGISHTPSVSSEGCGASWQRAPCRAAWQAQSSKPRGAGQGICNAGLSSPGVPAAAPWANTCGIGNWEHVSPGDMGLRP